jgi:hypothetical protein
LLLENMTSPLGKYCPGATNSIQHVSCQIDRYASWPPGRARTCSLAESIDPPAPLCPAPTSWPPAGKLGQARIQPGSSATLCSVAPLLRRLLLVYELAGASCSAPQRRCSAGLRWSTSSTAAPAPLLCRLTLLLESLLLDGAPPQCRFSDARASASVSHTSPPSAVRGRCSRAPPRHLFWRPGLQACCRP